MPAAARHGSGALQVRLIDVADRGHGHAFAVHGGTQVFTAHDADADKPESDAVVGSASVQGDQWRAKRAGCGAQKCAAARAAVVHGGTLPVEYRSSVYSGSVWAALEDWRAV